MSETNDQVQEILDAAMRMPAAERRAYIKKACASNEDLRREVASLIAALEDAPEFLVEPTVSAAPHKGSEILDIESLDPDGVGASIGPYTLVETLGQGGFGIVYRATQSTPVRREVAVKIIKLGMDTRDVVARFQTERQALALMDHPGIAHVHDAGATASGRPYFVMELVRGVPITEYSDRARLTVPERVRLLIQTCHAIEHAHQKGVIHRDIKPSNVLVADVNNRPLVKVIDFGVAKATAAGLATQTLHTRLGQIVGTPEYMSPEQASASALEADTRSDVYSLGVLLYELLTGGTPMGGTNWRSKGFAELQRVIQEWEAPRPSARLTPTTNEHERVAERRRTPPSRLVRQLRGDLDWITTKALEKDRGRRYDSVAALRRDLERFLENEPVEAGPPSTVYRARRFVRRHRLPVAAGTAVALAVLAGVVGTSIGLMWALRTKGLLQAANANLGETNQRLSETNNRLDAALHEAEAARERLFERNTALEAVLAFQSDRWDSLDPADLDKVLRETIDAMDADESGPRPVRFDATGIGARFLHGSLFQPAIDAAIERLAEQPLVQAAVLQSLANPLVSLGLAREAREAQDIALAVRERHLGPNHPDVVSSLVDASALYRSIGRFDEAQALLDRAGEAIDRMDEASQGLRFRCLNQRGLLLMELDEFQPAERVFRDALRLSEHEFGFASREAFEAAHNVAFCLIGQRRWAEAEPVLVRVYEWARSHAPQSTEAIIATNNLAALRRGQGRLDRAIELFEENLESIRRRLGETHPNTLVAMGNLGATLVEAGHAAEGIAVLRRLVQLQPDQPADESPDAEWARGELARALQRDGQLEEAIDLFGGVYDRTRQRFGMNHRSTLLVTNNYAGALLAADRDAEALGLLQSAAPFARERWSGENPLALGAILLKLGEAMMRTGELGADVESVLLESYELARSSAGEGSTQASMCADALGRYYLRRHEQQPGAGWDDAASSWSERARPSP